MSVKVIRGPMTPMYSFIWDVIGKFYGRWPSGAPLKSMNVLSRRLAVLSPKNLPNPVITWLHICWPRKLYNKVNNLDQRNGRDLSFDVNWHTNINSLKSTRCSKCQYELTKKEKMIVILGALGMKR